MNNKLRELAEHVGISFGGHPMNPLSVYPSELEKFAELIIEEYRTVITEVYREMPLEQCGWMLHLDEKILERFYNERKN